MSTADAVDLARRLRGLFDKLLHSVTFTVQQKGLEEQIGFSYRFQPDDEHHREEVVEKLRGILGEEGYTIVSVQQGRDAEIQLRRDSALHRTIESRLGEAFDPIGYTERTDEEELGPVPYLRLGFILTSEPTAEERRKQEATYSAFLQELESDSRLLGL